MKVSIEYCASWNYKPRASRLEQELKQALGSDLEVELIASSGGVYEICVHGKNIFSKKQLYRFPDDGEILNLINR